MYHRKKSHASFLFTTITVTLIVTATLFKVFYQSTVKKSVITAVMSINDLEIWRDSEKNDDNEDVEEQIQRDLMYDTILPKTSVHGVKILMKTLDSAILLLKVALSVDKRLQKNPKIDNFFEYLCKIEQNCVRVARQGFLNFKVLIVEGLQSSGKSTLINGLKSITRGTAITSIPAHLLAVRYIFDSYNIPQEVMRALDYVINYCIAHEVIADSISQPPGHVIIIEQYYHAVCAQTVCANVTEDKDLNTLPCRAFEWPIDLPVPHLVMFLTLSTPARLQRQHSNESSTEKHIARDMRAQTAYSLVTGPPTIALDASVGPDDVLDSALQACEEFGIYTPPPVTKGQNKRMSIGMYGAFSR